MRRGFEKVAFPRGGASNQNKHSKPKLQLIWGPTMYHFDDLPFPVSNLTESSPSPPFGAAASCRLQSGRPLFFVLDEIGGWGTIPTLESLGLSVAKESPVREGNMFHGGETAALGRVLE